MGERRAASDWRLYTDTSHCKLMVLYHSLWSYVSPPTHPAEAGPAQKWTHSAPHCEHTHTHTHLTALFPGLPGWAGTRKVKPIWILLKQETVSSSGISWAILKSASHSRQITMPAPHHSFFTGRMPFLPPNQQCQCTEGTHCTSEWKYQTPSILAVCTSDE